MKYLCSFLVIFLFTVNAEAQLTTNIYWSEESGLPGTDIIYYHPEKNLQWTDFRGAPNTGGDIAAITMSGFGYKASMKNNGRQGQLNIGIYCYFSKNKSWVKPDKKTAYILNHEQHHFDVSYIAALYFQSQLKNTLITPANANSVIPRLYKECCDMMNKMQDDYDGQTKNGQLKDMQEKWNDFLDKKKSLATR